MHRWRWVVLVAAACTPRLPDPMPTTGLQLFEDEGAYGYRTDEGEVVLPAIYDMASPFTDGGIAWVATATGLAWIDATGDTIALPLVVDNGPDPFVEDRARVVADGLIGFIDPSGRVVIPPAWRFATPFSSRRALFCVRCERVADGEHTRVQGGTWGAVDPAGVEVARPTHATRLDALEAAHAVPPTDLEDAAIRLPALLDARPAALAGWAADTGVVHRHAIGPAAAIAEALPAADPAALAELIADPSSPVSYLARLAATPERGPIRPQLSGSQLAYRAADGAWRVTLSFTPTPDGQRLVAVDTWDALTEEP